MTSQAHSDGGTSPRQVTVFLLDDHEVVRRSVRDMLEAEPDKLGMERRTQAAAYVARIFDDSATE